MKLSPFSPPARLLLPLLVVVLVGASTAHAATEARTISLNANRIAIGQLVKQVGEATGHTILVDDRVRGTLSIVAKRPVTLDEAWAMLDSALNVLGYTILPSPGGIWRILPVAEAIGESPFRSGPPVGELRDAYVTALIPLRAAAPATVLAALQPLAGSRVTLVPFERTGSLIASGSERDIARLTSIADELDRVEQRDIRHRVLRHRAVADLEPMIDALFESQAISAEQLEVWSDARTNSIIYRGSESRVASLLELLDRMDRPIEGTGEIRILKVLHRDAQEMADLLQSLSGSGGAARAAIPVASGTVATTVLEESDYAIAVDSRSRSLVVRANPRVHEAIRYVLELVDRPPQLIALDLKIVQVLTPSSFTLGAAFNVPLSPGNDVGEVIARLVSNPGGAGLLAQPNAQTPLFARVSRDAGIPFDIEGEDGIAIPIDDTGVIDAGAFRARTDVLIQPSLVITAGDQHEIFVGDNFPVPVTDEQGFATTVDVTGIQLSQRTNIERRDVGVLVRTEARAGEEGPIALDLDIDLSSLAPSQAGDVRQVGPTFIQQNLQVTARLLDGEIAVIALDRESQTSQGETGTPFLKDLPFLGWLFKRRVDLEDERRLVISVQARRLGTQADRAADSIRRRLVFERQIARESGLPSQASTGAPYAVRVTTRLRQEDAQAISDGLVRSGYAARVHQWNLEGETRFDVYVIALDSMVDAAAVAARLGEEGWEADLVLLPVGGGSA